MIETPRRLAAGRPGHIGKNTILLNWLANPAEGGGEGLARHAYKGVTMEKGGRTDGVIGLGLLVFSLVMYFFIIPNQIKEISFGAGSLSPSIFPKVAVVIIGFLATCLMINSFFFKRQTRLSPFGPKALAIILFLVAYVAGIQILGYYVATGLFLLALMIYLSREKWIKYTVIIVIFLVVNYLFFEKVLKLILPRGYLFN